MFAVTWLMLLASLWFLTSGFGLVFCDFASGVVLGRWWARVCLGLAGVFSSGGGSSGLFLGVCSVVLVGLRVIV